MSYRAHREKTDEHNTVHRYRADSKNIATRLIVFTADLD